MKSELKNDKDYNNWLADLKEKIKRTQIKAALSANKEVILLYWEIGKELFEKQENLGWGNAVVDKLEKDLLVEFPDSKDFQGVTCFI